MDIQNIVKLLKKLNYLSILKRFMFHSFFLNKLKIYTCNIIAIKIEKKKIFHFCILDACSTYGVQFSYKILLNCKYIIGIML